MDRQTASPIAVESGKRTEREQDNELFNFTSQFGDGRLVKMEIDYSSQVDDAILKANALAEAGKVAEAVESLYSLEKQTRLGCDMKSNDRILRAIVRIAFEGKEFTLLNDNIIMLCKKRSIIKYSIKNMIQDCCEMIEKIEDKEIVNKLVEVLCQVTSGKIYVEVERARLTKRMVCKLEEENKIEEARKMILELQVETYGSMDIQEKVQFLLHQMRLSIAQNDYLRASFVSKKISKKFFENDSDEIQELKLEYYKYMIQIGLSTENYLDVCKYYRSVFETPKIMNDILKATEALKCVVLYILLSSYDNEQWDLMHRINSTRELELIPEYKELLELFINQEIIPWKDTLLNKFEIILRQGTSNSIPTDVFAQNEFGNKKFERLRERVGEHNVRMIAKYYTQITFQRMSEILGYTIEEMEKFVCELIVTGVISNVKINRPHQIIYFKIAKASIDILDQWGSDIRKLTDILNKVSHLILKEEMVHKHLEVKRNI